MRKKKRKKKQNREPNRERLENSRGVGTLKDALSADTKASLSALRKNLVRRAEEAIRAQLAQPKPPWRRIASSELNSPGRPTGLQPMGSTPVRKLSKSGKRQRSGNTFDLRGTKIVRSSQTHLKMLEQVTNTGPRVSHLKQEPFVFWDLPSEATVREKPPEAVGETSRVKFDRIVSAGASVTQREAGEPLWVVIGLDFGTSCTKVIVRMPFEPDEKMFAIPAPDYCRSAGHPYLWQTVVWVRRSREFIAYPEKGARSVQTLKQGVMASDPNAPVIQGDDQQNDMTRLDAVAAYLTYVIRYVRGWLTINRPKRFRGRQPIWFVNLGLAAAYYDNEILFQTYRKAGSTALMLANSGDAVSVETIKTFRGHEAVVNAARSNGDAAELGIAVIPETAASATAFAKSTQSATGLYLMVDVGAMTLDVCSFGLNKQQTGTDQYPLLMVDVRPLGVDAFHWFLEKDRTKAEFERQCRHCLWNVVWETKQKRDPNANCWQPGNELPVFLTGGGSRNKLHRSIIKDLNVWMKKHTRNSGSRLLELPVPATVDLPEPLSDLRRMAVAFGLSYLPTEIGTITSPSDIDDIHPPGVDDYTKRFPAKEEVE